MIPSAWEAPKLTGRSSSFLSAGVTTLVVAVMFTALVFEEAKEPTSNLVPGEPFPEYAAISEDGTMVSIEDFKGKVVLLSFWATWCSDCVAQLQTLQQLKDEFGDKGLELVSVSVDEQAPTWVRDYLAAGGHDWLSLTDDPGHIQEVFAWGRRLPKTVLVNRDGTLGVWWRGKLDAQLPENRRLIEEAMSGKAVWTPGGPDPG